MQLGILMVLGGFLETLSVSLVMPFMEAVMQPENVMKKWYIKLLCSFLNIQTSKEFLVALAIVLAFLYLFKNAYLLFEYNIQYRFVYRNMFEMQRSLLASLIHRPYEYFLKINSGEIIRIVNEDTAASFNMLSQLLNLFTEFVVLCMVIAAVFIIMPETTICIAAVLFVVMIVINAFLKPVLNKAGSDTQNASAGMQKWLLQSIQGIKEIKVTNKESFFQQEYDSYGKIYVNTRRLKDTLALMPRFMIEGVSMGAMFIIISFLIYSGSELSVIVPMLSVVAMAAIRILPSVNRISGVLATIAYTEPMLDTLIENLSDIHDSGVNLENVSGQAESITKTAGKETADDGILFQNITYYYPGTDKKIFSDACMSVKKGESIGVAGISGSGKTTAVDIILGLLNPQEGQVLADGTDIQHDLDAWHCKIGYIPQVIFMLDDTIRANIAFGEDAQKVSDDQVWKALEHASLADFVRQLPEGLDTEIGERGVRISGGQRQRIGIARSLYRNPEILVFDEATSALDHDTETSIMKSIHRLKGEKTLIIIAHRLTTIEECDHIFRVEDGKIIKER